MSILDVPGARLHYEVHGSGPPLLMVPGASGEAGSFSKVTAHLAEHYAVVTYDRRGFSRSQLDGPQDHDRRLETDADDVRRLLEHLGEKPATVFGNSSGGIVALEVLVHHPSAVRTLVSFEPPAVRLLPDGQQWLDFFSRLYDRYRSRYVRANATYWFEHELRQYPAADLDLNALNARADQIVPAAGRESRGRPAHEASVELAKKLGRDLVELPGGHIGFVTHPAQFARELVQALDRAGHGPKG